MLISPHSPQYLAAQAPPIQAVVSLEPLLIGYEHNTLSALHHPPFSVMDQRSCDTQRMYASWILSCPEINLTFPVTADRDRHCHPSRRLNRSRPSKLRMATRVAILLKASNPRE
jgi:hypothetical protein